MSDYLLPLVVVAVIGSFISGLAYILITDTKNEQIRYEQCIAANKQWVRGNCIK